MVDTEKIRLMAQAASYEEKMMRHDSFVKRFYKQDYVDKEKLKARFFATIFFLLFWGYKAVKIFFIDRADLLHYDYTGLVIRILVEYVILLIIVSVIAGLVHARRYEKAKERVDSYFDLLDQIDLYN